MKHPHIGDPVVVTTTIAFSKWITKPALVTQVYVSAEDEMPSIDVILALGIGGEAQIHLKSHIEHASNRISGHQWMWPDAD